VQVEDMLRRSFAEFHAQRAQPGKSAALAAGQTQLAAYQASRWPGCVRGCDRQELSQYVALSQRIDDISSDLQVCGSGVNAYVFVDRWIADCAEAGGS
jgi:antiviral helicase SKI2